MDKEEGNKTIKLSLCKIKPIENKDDFEEENLSHQGNKREYLIYFFRDL